MSNKFDFLVIGSGMAGLIYALKVASYGNVCVLAKLNMDNTATSYAQGGIAAVMYSPDNYKNTLTTQWLQVLVLMMKILYAWQ